MRKRSLRASHVSGVRLAVIVVMRREINERREVELHLDRPLCRRVRSIEPREPKDVVKRDLGGYMVARTE